MTELRVISKINPEASDADLMAPEIHDRILDAYFGKMGDQFMRDTQKRVHWVCKMVQGPHVLDVGCSQGIVPVLLGREGYIVTGIDSDSQAISDAQSFLAEQKQRVKNNVSFINEDFTLFPFDGQLFDTVIISEVLEHLVNPALFVSLAAERLAPGGRLVVTVPFGINDFIDHKWTFYALEPLRLIWELFSVDEVELFGKWIGFSCSKRKSKARKGLTEWPWSLLEQMEEAFHSTERTLLTQTESLRVKIEDANKKYRLSTEQVGVLKENLSRQEASQKKVEGDLKQAQIQFELAQGQRANERIKFGQEIALLIEDGQTKSDVAYEVEKQLIRREAELEAVRGQLDDANLKYRSAVEEVTNYKKQLAQQEIGQKAIEGDLKQNQVKLEELRARLAEERIGFQQEIARLTVEGQGSEAELNLFRDQLEEANQKYCASSEKIVDLQRCFAEESASLRTVEEELRTSLHAANLKYRQVTGQEIPLLKQKLEIQVQRHKEKTDHVRREAELKVAKVRDTLSFRLGYILLHCLKSHRNFKRLPKDLWLLRREAVRRKQTKFIPEQSILRQKPEGGGNASKWEPGSPLIARAVRSIAAPVEIPQLNITDGLCNLRVACVMDEFTFGSYAPECALTQLTPAGWEAELEASAPELLFIESAWRGKDELWGNKVGHTSQELQGIVAWCRQRNIPTLFWNKEDPVHFETFLTTARIFDYVFTTDIDCIHRYKAALGHERVFLLPFACQPKLHNPIEKYERKDAFCFAGAYYARYPERIKDLESFVDEIPAFKPLEIFDRNYGQKDPNYMFPHYYQPCIIGTLPYTEIDKAYKGYRYAINLNSIKQSQSMFARRVYELLASNTITVSNFSRGVRLLFGDLVVTTDSGREQVRRIKALTADDLNARKFRLAALRKVLQEHTYGQRLAYVASKISGEDVKTKLPHIAVLARARSNSEQKKLIDNFERQSYRDAMLYLVVEKVTKSVKQTDDDRIIYLLQSQIKMKTIGALVGEADLVAGMVVGDYYGPNYLADIALAKHYTDVPLLGKSSYFTSVDDTICLQQDGQSYRSTQQFPARSAAIHAGLVADKDLFNWVTGLADAVLEAESGLALDEFNYCRNVVSKDEVDVAKHVDDLAGLDTGISVDDLLCRAEQIAPEKTPEDECVSLSGKALAESFSKAPGKAVQLRVDGAHWQVTSSLEDGKHEYLYATEDHAPASLGFKDALKLYLDVTPGLNIQLVVVFLDSQKQKISHVIKYANRNQEADIPLGTAWIRFGLRFYAGGSADIKGLVLGHRNLQPAEIIGRAEHLLLTNHYPSYDDLYRNGFVHSRVRAYRERGCKVDVFRLRTDEAVSFHEFEDIDVTTGDQKVLHQMLSTGQYKSVLVHFLDPEMWEVLKYHIDRIKVFVWVHGAEIHPWYRRSFNHENEQARDVAKPQSERRMAFWRRLLSEMPENLQLIFVSNTFAEEVMEDLGFRLPENSYTMIHNPISTDFFVYQAKSAIQRMKILSIRPYATKQYANDLSVKAILALAKMPWFNDMEFRIIGDGKLFDETLKPLRQFDNVHIERRFLTHDEIAELHREYGVFLCPTRWDSHGVSRDEAMSSGLVPVTNRVAAIPEFVDEKCGFFAESEDAGGLASGIAAMYENPKKFLAMSQAASERVRDQRSSKKIIDQEFLLFAHHGLVL